MIALIALPLFLLPTLVAAQDRGRPASPDDSVPHTAASAEQRARTHPAPLPTDQVNPTADPWVGPEERRCVEVGARNVVRAGDFEAGPFTSYPDIWHRGYAKLWWHPTTLPEGATLGTGPPLIVSAVRLDSTVPPVIFERATLARTIPEPRGVKRGVLFYLSAFRLPMPGSWLLVARAGRNWGCFLYDLP